METTLKDGYAPPEVTPLGTLAELTAGAGGTGTDFMQDASED